MPHRRRFGAAPPAAAQVRAISRKTGCATRQSADPRLRAVAARYGRAALRRGARDAVRASCRSLVNCWPRSLQAAPVLAFSVLSASAAVRGAARAQRARRIRAHDRSRHRRPAAGKNRRGVVDTAKKRD
jgi:hypothetical protein